MAYEYYLRFHDRTWFGANREDIVHAIERLPTYAGSSDGAFLLQQPQYNVPDIRLWVGDGHIFIERTALVGPTVRDLVTLVKELSERTSVRLVDEDDEPVILPSSG